MSQDHHTPYTDGVTEYKASDMNSPLGELDNILGEVSGELNSTKHTSHAYDMGIYYPGKPTADEVLLRFQFTRVVNFGTDMSGSQATAGIAATAETIFSLQKDSGEIATCTFGAASSSGTYSGEDNFSAGEILRIVAPAVADATLENIGFSLAGTR